MAPVRDIVENIGGDVSWDAKTKTITLTRAAKTIKLTLGSKIMLVNGKRETLYTPPIKVEGQTYVPLFEIMWQFSQRLDRDEIPTEVDIVDITEDFDLYTDKSLHKWILGMNAIYRYTIGNPKAPYYIKNYRCKDNVEYYRNYIADSFASNSHDEMVEVVTRMTENGHNSMFMHDAELVNSLTDKEYKELIEQSTDKDKYMWKYVKDLSAKWGDKGIIAWDLYRMSNISIAGYQAGYLEFSEAYELIKKIAEKLQETFSSWEEANENYLDGYAYWSRTDVTLEDTEYVKRKKMLEEIKAEQENHGELYDDTIWEQPIN